MEFDLVMWRLEGIVKDNLYCEDGMLRISTKLKYDVINLMEELDKKFMSKLKKELEYDDKI